MIIFDVTMMPAGFSIPAAHNVSLEPLLFQKMAHRPTQTHTDFYASRWKAADRSGFAYGTIRVGQCGSVFDWIGMNLRKSSQNSFEPLRDLRALAVLENQGTPNLSQHLKIRNEEMSLEF